MSTYTPNPGGQAKFYEAVTRAANAGLLRGAVECKGLVQRALGPSAGRGIASAPGSPPNSQRGGLSRSIYAMPGANFRAHCGSQLPYAKIQEKGGTIRAVRSKYLPVPLNLPAQRLLDQHGSTTEYFNGVGGGTGYLTSGGLRYCGVQLQVIARPGKPPLLVGKQGPRAAVSIRRGHGSANKQGDTIGNTSGVPVFVLVRQVRLPPRPFLLPTYEGNKAAIRSAIYARAAEVFAQEGFGGLSVTGGTR